MENFLKASLATLGAFLLVIVAGVGQAKATPVTFSTTGSFNGGAFTNPASIVFDAGGGNTLTLTFTGISPAATVNPAPSTFASLGTMNTSATGTGATITPGTTFTIHITQTVPSAGTGDLSGSLSGTIDQNTSTGQITFTVTSVTIGAINYSIANNPLALVPPNTNGGNTTIQGIVTDTTVPEPSSMLLLGMGLMGIAGVFRRRLKARG